MKAFFCELLFSCLLAAPGAKPIDELTYGTLLYAYYQQDYQQALLDGLVAEAQGREGDETIKFDLARGSFAFADGMGAHGIGEHIEHFIQFDQLIDQHLKTLVVYIVICRSMNQQKLPFQF